MYRLIISGFALLTATAGALASEVYENLTNPAAASHVLLPAGAAASEEHGNRITLAPGLERATMGIRFAMEIGGAGPATFQYRVRFYAVDGVDGAPNTQLYDSNWRNGGIDSGAPLTYVANPSELLLPTDCAWSIQVRNRTGNTSDLGPVLYGPPTAGESETGFWRRLGDGTWERVDNGAEAFGAIVFATEIPGDTDHDCDVDLTDLSTLLAYFGSSTHYGPEYGDTQNDGDVDIADLALLLTWFGAVCP